jgi:alpha-tubulin suppressor-like RCC1 family protein
MLLPKALPCVDTYADHLRADCHSPTTLLASSQVRGGGTPLRVVVALCAGLAVLLLASSAGAEQSTSKANRLQAAEVDAGGYQSCAILAGGSLRCWGWGAAGDLGYGNTNSIGDNELPSSVGPVDLGAGRTAMAIALGERHGCAILDTRQVRCWGEGTDGRLGYGNQMDIGDTELPGSVGPVDLGPGRTARAITAGENHTCAILDDGSVRCWGRGLSGRLGYGAVQDVGDNETPGSVAPVFLGPGRTARAITAGGAHTCALLDNRTVLCWGAGNLGALGYGNTNDIGDNESPGSVAPVFLGRPAVAISAGQYHTCALLDDGTVRCWGFGESGQLGYGNTQNIGDNELPGTVGPVQLGGKAIAVGGGYDYTCALLVGGSVRCWGDNPAGQLGYGNNQDIGDNEPPSAAGPVQLGASALSISAGWEHACVLLTTGAVKCWGRNGEGQLGFGIIAPPLNYVGDDETPLNTAAASIGGLVVTHVRPNISLRLNHRRDRVRAFRFTASGELTRFFLDHAMCSGAVRVRAAHGRRSVTKFVPAGLARDGHCRYSARFRVPVTGFWRVTARFAGNGSLLARTSTTRRFLAG